VGLKIDPGRKSYWFLGGGVQKKKIGIVRSFYGHPWGNPTGWRTANER